MTEILEKILAEGDKGTLIKALIAAQGINSDAKISLTREQLADWGTHNTAAISDGKVTYGEVRESLKKAGIAGIAETPNDVEFQNIQNLVTQALKAR
jgi:hypothetical protein